MAEQKAIEEFYKLKKTRLFIPRNNTIDIAIKALEKQIPIKPIGRFNLCPKCQDVEFGFNEPKYCPNCGQAIKWDSIF